MHIHAEGLALHCCSFYLAIDLILRASYQLAIGGTLLHQTGSERENGLCSVAALLYSLSLVIMMPGERYIAGVDTPSEVFTEIEGPSRSGVKSSFDSLMAWTTSTEAAPVFVVFSPLHFHFGFQN